MIKFEEQDMIYGRNSGRHLDVGTAFVWSLESAYSAGFHIPCDTLAIPYHWFKKKALTTMRDTAPISFPLCSSCPLSFLFLSAFFPLPFLFLCSSFPLPLFFLSFFHFPFFLSSLPFLFLSLHRFVPPLSSSKVQHVPIGLPQKKTLPATLEHGYLDENHPRTGKPLGRNPLETSVF